MNSDYKLKSSDRNNCKNNNNKSLVQYTVDSYDNGIAFGQHRLSDANSHKKIFNLKLEDNASVTRPRSRFPLTKDKPLHQLERYLIRLSERGLLHSSHIIFGASTDPFHPFEGKFDTSIKFLDIFKRYTPGLLTIQTRSPLIVIALPVLASLGKHVTVTLGIETNDEHSVRRYTPGLPRVEERLKTATALRRFGVEVTLQVAPLLPYGDWNTDAHIFAQTLVNTGDYITVDCLQDSLGPDQKAQRTSLVAKRLAEDRKFHWLRKDAARPLHEAVKKLAPEKLNLPVREFSEDRQLSIFAA